VVLGDFMSAEQREEFVRTRLVPGRIIRICLELPSGPKVKFMLVAHVGVETLGLVINSGINAFKSSRQELLECQVPIDVASHEGLDHDSYVDCTYAHYEDSANLRAQLVADIGGVRDRVSDQVRAAVLAALKDSYVLERVDKQRLVDNLASISDS
jgi:hypothetical protein